MTTTTADPTTVLTTWIDRVAAQDLAGAVSLYDPAALFTFHVPGSDGVYTGREAVATAIHRFFIVDRLHFAISDLETVADPHSGAVRFTMTWIDANDGARCTCFQSHHVELEGDRITHQHMYCAGIRAELP